MLGGPRRRRLRMLHRQHWAVGLVEHPRRCRTEEHPPKAPRMRRHHDEVKFALLRSRTDRTRRIAFQQQPPPRTSRKTGMEKQREPIPRQIPVVLGDLITPPRIKLKAIVTCEITHVGDGYIGAE